MTSLVTKGRTTTCDTCHAEIGSYYTDLKFKGKVCGTCLKNSTNGFPKGKGSNVPCKLCEPPKIRWFHKTTSGGESAKDCGNHCDGGICKIKNI